MPPMPPFVVNPPPLGATNGSVYAIGQANTQNANRQLASLLGQGTSTGGSLRKKGGAANLQPATITVAPLQMPYPGSTLPNTNTQLTKLFAVNAAQSAGDDAWKLAPQTHSAGSRKRRVTRSNRRSSNRRRSLRRRSNRRRSNRRKRIVKK